MTLPHVTTSYQPRDNVETTLKCLLGIDFTKCYSRLLEQIWHDENKMILREKKFSFIHTHTRLTFNFLLLLLCTYYDVNVQKQKTEFKKKKRGRKVRHLLCFVGQLVESKAPFLFLVIVNCFKYSFPAIYQYTYCKTQIFKPVNYSLKRHFKGPGHRSHFKTLGSWILGPT